MGLLNVNFDFRVTMAEIMSNNHLDADVSEAVAKVSLRLLMKSRNSCCVLFYNTEKSKGESSDSVDIWEYGVW